MPRAKGGAFRSKRSGFGEKARRQKKLAKKSKNGDDGGGGGKPKRNAWSLLGLVATLAVSAAAVLGLQRQDAKNKRKLDLPVLARLLAKPLEYTEHGACRMDCRFITKSEVVEMLSVGRINRQKSVTSMRPCPKYVVDAKVGGQGKNVQGVFSACPAATRVVTVIDKDTDHPCPPC